MAAPPPPAETSGLLRALEAPATRAAVLRCLLKQFSEGALTAEENALLNAAFTSPEPAPRIMTSRQSRDVSHASNKGRTASFDQTQGARGDCSRRSEQPTVRELMAESAAIVERALPPPSPLVDAEAELEGVALDEEEQRFIMHDMAASKIQTAWRMHALGHDSVRFVLEHLGLDESTALHTAPSLEIAKQAAREMLPCRPDGELFAPTEGLAAFDSFGVEVSCYMRFVVYTGRVFMVALLLNLSNIISNMEGKGGAANLLATFSLNNADCLGSSYGVIEALTSAIFVGFVWWLRTSLEGLATRLQADEEADELLTAANFAVA
jgi:hypothetical protein